MTSPGDLTSRKPLDAQFVGKINQDAMKALEDVVARRAWPDSKSGNPITTNILCAEIARLNLQMERLQTILRETTAEAIEHRKNIIEARASGFHNIDDPKFRETYDQEIARMDARIVRATIAVSSPAQPSEGGK